MGVKDFKLKHTKEDREWSYRKVCRLLVASLVFVVYKSGT